jgi:hypothetical protein
MDFGKPIGSDAEEGKITSPSPDPQRLPEGIKKWPPHGAGGGRPWPRWDCDGFLTPWRRPWRGGSGDTGDRPVGVRAGSFPGIRGRSKENIPKRKDGLMGRPFVIRWVRRIGLRNPRPCAGPRRPKNLFPANNCGGHTGCRPVHAESPFPGGQGAEVPPGGAAKKSHHENKRAAAALMVQEQERRIAHGSDGIRRPVGALRQRSTAPPICIGRRGRAPEAVDDAVYQALRALKKLRHRSNSTPADPHLIIHLPRSCAPQRLAGGCSADTAGPTNTMHALKRPWAVCRSSFGPW